MKLEKHLLFFLAFFFSLLGCRDIIEDNIEGKTVRIIAPQDSLTSPNLTQNFVWEHLDGATHYYLQIVSPSFDNLLTFVLDTNVTDNEFTYTFAPGTYQWKIRPENGSSIGCYETRTLFIDSTTVLTGQFPVLISPAEGAVFGVTDVSFSWDEMFSATQYRMNFQNTTTGTTEEIVVVDNSHNETGLDEGVYTWQLRAENEFTFSAYASRNFTIDTTAPSAPVLTAPTHESTLANEQINFEWVSGIDALTSTTDSVCIYTDSLATTFAAGYPIIGTSIHTDSLGSGTFYWQIKTCDMGNNCTPSSELNQLTIIP